MANSVNGIAYSSTLGRGILSGVGPSTAAAADSSPPSPPVPFILVGGDIPWRLIVGTVPTGSTPGSPITTWAQGLWTARKLTFTLNAPAVIEAALVPDDPRVNTIYSDGFPFVSQSNRIIWAFQREGVRSSGGEPWVCRGAGVLMSPEDEGDDYSELTHVVAYDAWMYLNGRPYMDADGNLPVAPLYPDGIDYFATSGDTIITDALRNAIANGGFAFVDAGVANGGTAFYGGTIEPTPAIDYHIDAGKMVGEIWTELCDMGNCDIVLTPIYDPTNRPGYTHELNVYTLAGEAKPGVIFAWDRFTRQVTKISRQHDGTPGNFINIVQYFQGQGGGFPVPVQTNPSSVATFLEYWSQQFFPSQPVGDGSAVIALAEQALTMAKQGKRTMVLSPTPARSPVPFLEYGLGDRVAVFASKRLRVAATADAVSGCAQRIQAIPVEIDDDGVSRVSGLICTPDWRTQVC